MPHSDVDLTDSDLDLLEQCARAASPSPWSLGITPTETMDQAVGWMRAQVQAGVGPQLWMVLLGEWPEGEGPEIGVSPAYTGNGPTSEANARHLVAAQPGNMLALIASLRQARAEAREARKRLDEHALRSEG